MVVLMPIHYPLSSSNSNLNSHQPNHPPTHTHTPNHTHLTHHPPEHPTHPLTLRRKTPNRIRRGKHVPIRAPHQRPQVFISDIRACANAEQEQVRVDKELFGDAFRRAPRLTPLEARAIRLALEFVGPMIAAEAQTPLERVRRKLEETFGEFALAEGADLGDLAGFDDRPDSSPLQAFAGGESRGVSSGCAGDGSCAARCPAGAAGGAVDSAPASGRRRLDQRRDRAPGRGAAPVGAPAGRQ